MLRGNVDYEGWGEVVSKFGSHKTFIKKLGYEIEFCNACGEHISDDGECSNRGMCPEEIPDADPEVERQIEEHFMRKELFNPLIPV